MKKILILFIVFLSVITNIYSQTDNNDDCMCGVYPGNSFSGICNYSEAYKELVTIFQTYHHLSEPEITLCLDHEQSTEIITFDGKSYFESDNTDRIIIVEYDGINKITYFLERINDK
jgi:hypothetical protein